MSQWKLITGQVRQNLLSSTNSKTLGIALDEVKIFSAPMKNFEAWIEFVEKRLASTVEMIGYVKWAWSQSTEYLERVEVEVSDCQELHVSA